MYELVYHKIDLFEEKKNRDEKKCKRGQCWKQKIEDLKAIVVYLTVENMLPLNKLGLKV
jgi:hypothetical protein